MYMYHIFYDIMTLMKGVLMLKYFLFCIIKPPMDHAELEDIFCLRNQNYLKFRILYEI